ncbi:hypothetical protein [Geobacillus phage TP-84]|uniref:Uncharacterized protein n=1 Tax=Geobacillus phage TP-84 TaxID=1965361 RepID=A0A1U9WQP9_9CAUD|nr:hypothetical protein MUK65_gp07 [Geobacillus phage TP-84]AQY55105.1 hypothetical protein [Geobacillus phage TP-84]
MMMNKNGQVGQNERSVIVDKTDKRETANLVISYCLIIAGIIITIVTHL